MGQWSNTAFVRTDDAQRVVEALVASFEAEGYVAIDPPGERSPDAYDVMQYGDALASSVWGVAVVAGAPGWVALKTAPFELLCEKPPGSERPRLADVCQRLGAPGFQYNLYDGIGLLVVEANAAGAYAISGLNTQASDPLEAYGKRIPEARWEAGLYLIDAPQEVVEAFGASSTDTAWRIAQALGGAHPNIADNRVQVESLVPHRPIDLEGAQVVYFQRAELDTTVAPLALDCGLELEPSVGRLYLRGGAGEAHLQWSHRVSGKPDVLPMWGGTLGAADRDAAAGFIEHIAAWLGVEAPAPPDEPGLATGVHYSISAASAGEEPWKEYKIMLDIGAKVVLGLRVDRSFERAELDELDTNYRQPLVEGLCRVLREGPPRKPLPEGWQVASASPVVARVEPLIEGLYLEHTLAAEHVVASYREAGVSRLVRVPVDAAPARRRHPERVTSVDGVVSRLAGRPGHDELAAVVVHPERAMGIGGDDPAELLIIDARTGQRRQWLARGAISSFAHVCWSPDGAQLAVDVDDRCVILGADGKRRATVPSLGAVAVRWDVDGLLLKTTSRDEGFRIAYKRWRPTDGVVEPHERDRFTSPDGRFEVEVDGADLVVRAQGTGAQTDAFRLAGEPDNPFGPAPGIVPVWLDERRLVLEGEEPLVVDLVARTVRYLLPRARVREFEVDLARRLVLVEPKQGELWWGRLPEVEAADVEEAR